MSGELIDHAGEIGDLLLVLLDNFLLLLQEDQLLQLENLKSSAKVAIDGRKGQRYSRWLC